MARHQRFLMGGGLIASFVVILAAVLVASVMAQQQAPQCLGAYFTMDKQSYTAGETVNATLNCGAGAGTNVGNTTYVYTTAPGSSTPTLLNNGPYYNVQHGYLIPISTTGMVSGTLYIKGCYNLDCTVDMFSNVVQITGGACSSISLTLNDNKTTYTQGDNVNYTYACNPTGTRAANTVVQLTKPDGSVTTYNSGTNIDTASLGFSTSNLTPGQYMLRVCADSSCGNTTTMASMNFTVITVAYPPTQQTNFMAGTCRRADGTTYPTRSDSWCEPNDDVTCPTGSVVTPNQYNGRIFKYCYNNTASSTNGTTGITLNSTIYRSGQYQDPATGTIRTCVSPNYWMKEGVTSSGARSWHCMTAQPSYTPTSNDTFIPASCATIGGTLWAGSTPDSDYCSSTAPSTTNGGSGTNGSTCTSGQVWCPAVAGSSSPAGCYTTCPTASGVTPGIATSCANGARCPSGSWCSNGSQCYYPTGELTCVAWPASNGTTGYAAPMGNVECPSGTSECSPTDTNCVAVNQVIPYASGKWCRSSDSYYSTDGRNMTCVKMGSSPPPGYTSCRPDDTNCIPREGYGSSSGWCAGSSMQCYQQTTDSNQNNDKYCAPMAMGVSGSDVTCPSGYSVCSPTDTNCFAKGDIIPQDKMNSGVWCSGAQKCTLSDGSGKCVGWNESCPAGSKYCGTSDTNCIEPGEYKTISTTSGNSYWCGGSSGGMTFYNKSESKAYCALRPSGSGSSMMMWTSADVKGVLTQLGSGWGLCGLPSSYGGGYGGSGSKCLEPGQTGSSSDWCGWMPPGYYGPYNSASNGGTRTCPLLDESIKPVEPEKPPVTCPAFAVAPRCFPGEIPEMQNGCQTGKCVKDPNYKPDKPILCPILSATTILCLPGHVIRTDTTPDGCSISHCVPENEIKPPFPPTFPGGDKDIKSQIFNYREELRGYRRMIIDLEAQTKDVPELKEIVASANKAVEELRVLLTGGKYDKTTFIAVKTKMETFRNEIVPQLTSPEIRVYSEANFLVKQLAERIKFMEGDIERHGDSETASRLREKLDDFKFLLEDVKDAAKSGDVFLLDDTRERLRLLEESMREIYDNAGRRGRQSFVRNSIDQLRAEIAAAKAQMESQGLTENDDCAKADENMTRVLSIVANAEAAYNGGNEQTAAELLDKAFFFKDPTFESLRKCGVLNIESVENRENNINNLFQGTQGISEETIDKIVDKIVAKSYTQFQTLLNNEMQQMVQAIAELQTVATERITTSLAVVQKLDEETRQEIMAVKQEVIAKVQEAEGLLSATKLAAQDRQALIKAMETATTYNWCGPSGRVIVDRTNAITEALETKDTTKEDVQNYVSYVSTMASANAQQCYDSGASRFPDTPLHEWYAPYTQGQSEIFKGRIVDGVPYFEPPRNVSRAEALVAIMRTAREAGLDTGETNGPSCTPPVAVPSSLSWVNCALSASERLDYMPPFAADMGATASREDIALIMYGIFGEQYMPVIGDTSTATVFVDDNTRDQAILEAVGTMVENQIMVGRDVTHWGYGQPITRAELAATIERVRNIISVTAR